jgi:beta-mannanase
VFGQLKVNQPQYRLSNIAGGAFDPYIKRYATEIKRYGGPVMLRPFHEMDGFWYPWGGTVNGNSAADFVAAWRHIHGIFERAGATNVTWVWSVNRVSQPPTPANQIENYWPGREYVDWIGISAFNWGTGSPYAVWQGFDKVFGPRYRELLTYGKPIMLTETGAPEAGGNKAAWIRDAFHSVLARYPDLGGIVWYDKRDNEIQDWRIDSTQAALAAFRRAVALPGILSADRALATAVSGS